MKTLLFVHASADLYGSDVTLLQLVRGLDRDRFHAVVVLPYEGPLVPRLREAGAEVIVQEDLPIVRRQYMNPRGLLHLALSMRSVWRLSSLIRRRDVALVHGNTLAAVPLGLAAKLAGRPQVWHVHEITTKPRAVASALATLSSALSTRVIANSRATAEHYRRTRLVGSTPVEVILNGVEDDHVHGRREASPALREYADGEDTVFTLLGRINHWKGQSVFLDAAERLAVDTEDAKFLIVGDSFAGQEHFTEAVDRRIESSEVLRGRAVRLPYAPAGDIYEASDVVVVPSIEPEPFGLVAAEAMAAGLPVIASRIGALPEIVEDGVNGLLVNPDDPESLLAAMEQLQSSPSLRTEMGRRGRETFEEKFCAGRYVEEFAGAYEEIITRAKGPISASEAYGEKPVAFCGTRGLPANYGGFETAVDEISRRFVDTGQECVVFCRRSSGESWPDSHEGRRLKYVSGSRRRSLDTFVSAFQTGWHLLRNRREYGYVFWFNNANLPGILLTLLARIPLAVNTDGLEWRRAKWKKPFKLYYFLSSALVSILCRDLISDSRAIQDYYLRAFSKRTWFIPYGVPQTPSPSPEREAEILDSYGVEPGRYFLQITRFEPDNLPLEAAHAFRDSGLSEAGYKFLLVGRQHDTPYTQRITNLSGEGGVRVADAVYDPEVISALRNNCFCYVHGNSVGGTNPALLEAMASCARVLAVEGPFSREVLGETGLYFDPDGLVPALHSATQSPENSKALQERVHYYYRWDAVARSYLELAKRKLDTKDTEDTKSGAHHSSVGQ